MKGWRYLLQILNQNNHVRKISKKTHACLWKENTEIILTLEPTRCRLANDNCQWQLCHNCFVVIVSKNFHALDSEFRVSSIFFKVPQFLSRYFNVGQIIDLFWAMCNISHECIMRLENFKNYYLIAVSYLRSFSLTTRQLPMRGIANGPGVRSASNAILI